MLCEQCIFVQLHDQETEENTKKHDRLVPKKFAKNCGSQFQMVEYCYYDTVYAIKRHIPWSQLITRRELGWLGHLFRLGDDTPAEMAIQYSLRQTKKSRGRQQTTRISMMKIKLLDIGLEWEVAKCLAKEILAWNNFTELM